MRRSRWRAAEAARVEAERHQRAIAAARRRAPKEAARVEQALTELRAAVAALTGLRDEAVPSVGRVVRGRLAYVLGDVIDVREHPDLQVRQPLTEVFA